MVFFDHLVLVVSSALFVVFSLHCACAGYHRARREGLAARPGALCTWPNTAPAQRFLLKQSTLTGIVWMGLVDTIQYVLWGQMEGLFDLTILCSPLVLH